MNAMIRALKGILAVLALAGLGLLLRWMTAGSISGLRTYDLDSLTVVAVGTIAWIAYAWLTLAVLLTVLEQVPGVIGELAGAVAGRITTKTARALLRSGLGVAAVTPLTVGVANAAPTTAHIRHTPEAPSTLHLGAAPTADRVHLTDTPQNPAPFRATEPRSTIHVGGNNPSPQHPTTESASTAQLSNSQTAPQQPAADRSNFRATEPPSTLRIGNPETDPGRTNTAHAAPQQHENETAPEQATGGHSEFRATEPASTVQIGGNETAAEQATGGHGEFGATEPASTLQIGGNETAAEQATGGHGEFRATEPASTVQVGGSEADSRKAGGEAAGSDRPAGERQRTDVPNQPAGEHQRGDVPNQAAGERARVGVPDRPTDGAPTRYTELRPRVPVRVVVREGDSLWSIAARELGPAATNDAIAARWPDWYAANRQVIGDDPDLILPGQVLRIPPAPNGDHLPPHHQEP
ncbi:LysM peptidoglycan-binding domain-containing protein [Kribbella shirazensis]|uniref:Nucleoid-associated protein YgaU n=1 Tax=Kribbella shirazensis TaxID=1105143 RepID=A0A7X5VIT7_9ACTN|nr:LysM peptidoglycan-binding domain-containing protein [Kribbella shirazensis]NIK62055.1 nucleoid-associated protein YgaU [Kribbella shirazensis]